jgi:hypothetical protein
VNQVRAVSHVFYPSFDREASLDMFVRGFGLYEQRRGGVIYAGIGDTLVEIVDASGAEGAYVEAIRRLVAPVGEEPPSLYAFGLDVQDLDALIASLEPWGVAVVRGPWPARTFWGRQAVVKDPVGQQIALREYREPDGPHYFGWHPSAPPA